VLVAGGSDGVIAASPDGTQLGYLSYEGVFAAASGPSLATLTKGWHRLTVVGTGRGQTYYLDGVNPQRGNMQSTREIYRIGNGPALSAEAAQDQRWRGAWAKLRLFNYAMTDVQVNALGSNLDNEGGAFDL